MTRAAPQNAPVEAQATLPWVNTPPPSPSRPRRANPANGGPVPPAGWGWEAVEPRAQGWSVAALADQTGATRIEVDATAAGYLVRRWTRTRGSTYRSAPQDTHRAQTFEAALALAVEKAK